MFLWKLIDGRFYNCVDEKGVFIPAQYSNQFPDSKSSESDNSDDDDFDNDLDEIEQDKLWANSVFEILDIGIATEKLVDACNCQLDIGTKYIKCHYLMKLKEKTLSHIRLFLNSVCVIITSNESNCLPEWKSGIANL